MAMTVSRTLAFCTLALSLHAGCARCSDEPRVPFKLNPPPEQPAPEVPVQDAALATPQSFEQPVDQLTVGDRTLALTHVRASLEVDLDADGDRDVLVLREDDAHKLQLVSVLREASGLSAPRALPGFFEQDLTHCRAIDARLAALSSSKAALSYALACEDPSTQVEPFTSLSLVSLEALPRVFERLDVIARDPAPERASLPALTLTPKSSDVDGDGHDDVAITVTGLGSAEPDALQLVYLDRPSGLLRDAREPEGTLSAWAAAASSLLAKTPERAIARAELGRALQKALCRESGAPAIALSGTPGVPCGSMKSTGSLELTRLLGHAKRGDLRATFDAYRELRHVEPKPSEKELEKAYAALLKLTPTAGVTLRQGPQVEPIRTPRVHLPSVRFVSEDVVYLNRLSPVLYDLAQDDESAAPSTSDALMRDPSGQLIAAALERTCDGLSVRIERAPPRGSDYTVSPAVANAVLVPFPASPGCNRSSTRPDDGGFTVLGWAPQGIVAARGSELRVAPLGSDGRPSGEGRELAPDAPRPAPLPSGSATADGARYVEATPYGILVYGPSSTHVELWRPEGYTAIAGRTGLEAAISPSARKVAVAASGQLYVLTKDR